MKYYFIEIFYRDIILILFYTNFLEIFTFSEGGEERGERKWGRLLAMGNLKLLEIAFGKVTTLQKNF